MMYDLRAFGHLDQNTEFTGKRRTRDTNFRTLLKRGKKSKEMMEDLENTGFSLHRRGASKITEERVMEKWGGRRDSLLPRMHREG